MVVKTSPASAFVMVQTQIVLAALKILLDGPTPATQSQSPAFGGRLPEPGDVNVIRIRLAQWPIGNQPARRPLPALFIQIAVEINLSPGQPGGPLLAIGCLPGRSMPFCRLEAFGQLAQFLTRGSGFGNRPILRTLAQFRGVGPTQPVLLGVKKIFQAQPANPPPQLASVCSIRSPAMSGLVWNFTALGTPAFSRRGKSSAQVSGKYSCPPTGAATSPSVTTNSTAIWHWACLPTAPQY